MGQKVNPHGLRVGVIKDWDSRWYARNEKVGDLLVEDYKLRKELKKRLYSAGVPKIEIERDNAKIRIYVHCARPGIVIGKGGEEIEKLRAELEKKLGKSVVLNIVEVKNPDTNAQLVAENIAQQLEKRIAFRRAMKNAMGRAMRMGALGIKVQASGRLNGAEIARTEQYHDGTIPLQTLRADIDYGFAEAATTYGRIGIKVWIYRGEVLAVNANADRKFDRPERRQRRGGEGGGPSALRQGLQRQEPLRQVPGHGAWRHHPVHGRADAQPLRRAPGRQPRPGGRPLQGLSVPPGRPAERSGPARGAGLRSLDPG